LAGEESFRFAGHGFCNELKAVENDADARAPDVTGQNSAAEEQIESLFQPEKAVLELPDASRLGCSSPEHLGNCLVVNYEVAKYYLPKNDREFV
jgi:hypothetical protein